MEINKCIVLAQLFKTFHQYEVFISEKFRKASLPIYLLWLIIDILIQFQKIVLEPQKYILYLTFCSAVCIEGHRCACIFNSIVSFVIKPSH